MNQNIKTTETVQIDGTVEIRFAGGSVIRQAPIATVDRQNAAGVAFSVAVDALSEFQDEQSKVERDDELATLGKTRRIEPLTLNCITQLGNSYGAVLAFETHLNKRNDALLAVPQLLPGDVANVSVDQEVRQWWRGLAIAERADVMRRIDAGPELARIELALLRSPIALADAEIAVIRASWNRGRRADNPKEAVDVAAGLASCAWAKRGLVQVAAAFRTSVDQHVWPDRRILGHIVNSPNPQVQAGFAVFGFDVLSVAEFKRQQAQAGAGAYQANA
jgi:hypothetical protein